MNEMKTNLTLKQRQRLQGKTQAASKPAGAGGGRKEVSRMVAILLLLLAFGGGTALGMIYFRPDPRLQELADMEAIMSDPNLSGELRRELGMAVEDDIPANLRGRRGGMRGDPEERDMARSQKFLAMSTADQLAELKKEAAREIEREARRAEREAEMAANAAAKPADSSQANSNGNGQGGGQRKGRAGRSDEQRTQRKEQGLANHPPSQRGGGTLMHQMRNAVKQQVSMGH